MVRIGRAVALALATGFLGVAAAVQAQPVLPAPAYDNTLYAFVYGLRVSASDGFAPEADALLERVQPGPYARVGLADYFALDMPWSANPATAALTAPSTALLESLAQQSEARGLTFHLSLLGGISRAVSVYTDAKREDRRNAQWFKDGRIVPPHFSGSPDAQLAAAYATPSRYARKLRRHLEAKVRAFAKRYLALRETYPETLVTVSGDAEAELNSEAESRALAYDDQLIADYSPFAILEFRDWLLHAGLYAEGGPYAGDGYDKKPGDLFDQGARALDAANLANFNTQFWTPFASWELKYFAWNLADPIDSSPRAISAARASAPGWSPLPTSGPDLLPAGFDAPRTRNQYNPAYWDLWLEFRATMLANYARDFATWMTTTPGEHGETLEPERWYSHQIPGDYLNGRHPGSPDPERRLIAAASPFWTSLVGDDVGSPGVTVLDRREADALGRPTYRRTSQFLFPVIVGLDLRNWGMPEYAPAWHIDVGPEPSAAVIVGQYLRAYQAGAHMFAFTPWPHFVDTVNGAALGDFVRRVKYQPRESGSTAFVPPPVHGLAGSATQTLGALSWSAQVFAGRDDFAWRDWAQFRYFEIWRGSDPGFTTSNGRIVRIATATTSERIPLSSSAKYYKVLAASRQGKRGILSNALLLEPGSVGTPIGSPTAGPGPQPTPVGTPTPIATPGVPGAGTRIFRSCRLYDSRYGTDAPLAPGVATVVNVSGRCGIPEGASAVLATVYVMAPAESGSIVIEPGDSTSNLPVTLSFNARRSVASKLSLALPDEGTVVLESRGPTVPVDVIVLAYGYVP